MTNTPPTGTTDPNATTTGTVADPSNIQTFNDTTDAANNTQSAFSNLGTVTDRVRTILGGFYDQISKVGINLGTNQRITEGQTAAFGALASSALGARRAFDNLSAIDTTGLNTFTRQWNDLQTILDNSPAFKTTKAVIDATVGALERAGAPMKKIEEEAKNGITALSAYASTFFESADNALRLQNAMVQLAARTGSLNELFAAGGPNLSHINELIAAQQKSLNDTAQATQLGADTIEKYYGQLGNVPKALDAVVTSGTETNKNVSLLTATIQYATGSGRSFEDVVNDLRTAFRDYNLTGEDALKFTAHMGEIANRFGVEIGDVQNNLRGTADMFKMFGNEAQGAAAMMNQYLGALESTGISGATALNVIQDMTAGIKGLGLAQKSFLSAQTGGPGGLMGAFQIEKALREGRLDEVMDKIRTTLTRQFGQITTLEEASRSPQAAAQLTRQIAMLRQGPLGSFARDDQSAIRLLEAIRNQQRGVPGAVAGALSPTIVQDTMLRGVKLQETAATELTHIRELIQNSQGVAGVANLTTAQRGFTARVGAPIRTGEFAGPFREDLRRNMQAGAEASGQTASDIAAGTATTRQSLGRSTAKLVENYKKFGEDLPNAIMAPINSIKSMWQQNSPTASGSVTNDQYLAQVNAIPNVPGLGGKAATVANMGVADTTATGAPVGVPLHPKTPATDATGKSLGEITVHVEGYCLDCGEKIRSRSQVYAVAPQLK